MTDAYFSIAILLLNIPFGIWRHRVKKYGYQWIMAIHIPVLIIITARFVFDIPYTWEILPINILAFFIGQYLGSRLSIQFIKSSL